MLTTYVPKTFTAAHQQIIDAANVILKEYAALGHDLTLRQLYYQFVARQPLPEPFANSQRSYKRLGKIISDARLAGQIDWSYIVDRTRNLQTWAAWSSPADIISASAHSYRVDCWLPQPRYVEVWIEKDALVGVLEQACSPWRVPYFSCRGYASQSELESAGCRIARKARHRDPLVLHLGDHDPSGIDMTRDIERRLSLFAEQPVEVRRLALNMPQIEELQPPPNPTKLSDSRAADYVAQFGYESWELDALTPTYIEELIAGEIGAELDDEAWEVALEEERDERALLRCVSLHWREIATHTRTNFDVASHREDE